MPMVWIVTGSTGEYSDRVEWPVIGYRQKDDAVAHMEAVSEEAFRLGASQDCKKVTYDAYAEGAEKNRYDPHMRVQYMGVGYYVEGVLFAEGPFVKLPEPVAATPSQTED